MVAKALHCAMQPLLESVFLPTSYGFRPGRGVSQLLADLAKTMASRRSWVVVEDDIRRAFDNVPIELALKTHRLLFNEPAIRRRYRDAGLQATREGRRIIQVIAALLRSTDQRRKIGIDQG